GDLRPAGERAGGADRVHRGLGAGIREAKRLHRGDATKERLGQPDLVLGRAGERHAEQDRFLRRLDDVGWRVAEDQTRVVAVEVETVDAVGVPDVRALGALDVERVGIEERRRAAVAAGHDGAGFLVERARPARFRQVLVQLLVDGHAASVTHWPRRPSGTPATL